MGERRKLVWLLLAGTALCTGCDNEDANRLARLGTKVGEKAQAFLAAGNGKLAHDWPHVPNADSPEARVAARLSWDKSLAGASIQVQPIPKGVQLLGEVSSFTLKRRAVHLAESTVGVDEVVDQLSISEAEPPASSP